MGCSGDPAFGVYGKLLLEPGESSYTWDSSSVRLEILESGNPAENLQRHERHVGGQGIWGGLYPLASRVREGGHYIYGSFTLNPSPGYFESLLPYLVGDDAGGSVFNPNDCPNWFGLLVYRDDHWEASDVGWEVADCRVDRWELFARAPEFRERGVPELLTLKVHIIAKTEVKDTAWPSPEPSMQEGAMYAPYIFQDTDDTGALDGTFTLNATDRDVFGFHLTYDNNLRALFTNSLTLSHVVETRRDITLDVHLPWSENNEDLYDMSYVGAAAQIKFAYSVGANAYSTQFDITNYKAPAETPFIKDRNEVYFTVGGRAYGDASNKEFQATNDNS